MSDKTPPRETQAPEDIASETSETRGWEGLADWTGGIPPEEVEPLAGVRDLESVYPLLHALIGRSPRDFFARAAVVEALVESARAALAPEDLDEVLYWLAEPARTTVLRSLSQSGWLEFDRAVSGYVLTDSGRWAHDVLSFLHRRLRESELLPTVAGVRYALDIGLDPVRHLQSMRSRLVALREEIDAAMASHSEVVLRRTADKLGEALALSGRIRAVLDAVRLDQVAARRVAREIHELLSRLHGAGAELHAAITEVGKQYLRLTAGLTVEQIVRALMDKSLAELAEVGRAALLPALAPPPLLTTEAVAHAAEIQALRDRPEAPPVAWSEPDEAPRAVDVLEAPPEVERLLADLAAIAEGAEPVPLARAVPAGGTGNPGESFLRASLLSLVGARWLRGRSGEGDEGIAGRLGALPLEIAVEGDGWPEPLPASSEGDNPPLTGLTPGTVRPERLNV
jgi:hypothetical protein